LWKNNTFAEPSASTRLVGQIEIVSFWQELFQPEYKILKKGFEEQLPKETIMRVFENRYEIL